MCRDECAATREHPEADARSEGRAPRRTRPGPRPTGSSPAPRGSPRFGSNFAPIVNGLLAPPIGPLADGEALRPVATAAPAGVRTRQLLPPRPPAWAGVESRKSRAVSCIRFPRPRRTPKVAYFVDIFANYNDPLIGEATVAVLRHNGIEVYVPPRQVGCGMAALGGRRRRDRPRDARSRNVRVLADLVREGYRIVCSEPTAALMLSQDYLDLLDDPDTAVGRGEHRRADDVPRRAARRRPPPHRLPPTRPHARASRPVPPEGARRAGRRAAAAVADSRPARPHHRRGLFRHGRHVGPEGREPRDLARRRRGRCSPS